MPAEKEARGPDFGETRGGAPRNGALPGSGVGDGRPNR